MGVLLLFQQYPTYLNHLIWMVLEMGGEWPYSCCFVGCCFQDLFNIAHSILVQLLYIDPRPSHQSRDTPV